jgi:hypothetical protein
MGFTDTRLINECLLSKWIMKIDIGYDYMCCCLLRKMYLKEKGFYCVSSNGGSQFWRGLHEIKYICQKIWNLC